MWPAAEVQKKSKLPRLLLLLLLLVLLAAVAAGAWYFLVREDDEAAAPARAAQTPLAGFVADVDGLLRVSARDRTRIKRAIVGVERNCRVPPGRAATDVSAVTRAARPS